MRTAENVGDKMSRQEGASQTHRSVVEISRNTKIRPSSVGRIINDRFKATHLEKNDMPYSLANIFSGSVATN